VRVGGERVAAVAAEDREAAEEALLLIDVEYEPLPTVFDPMEALGQDAPLLHPEINSYFVDSLNPWRSPPTPLSGIPGARVM
jgi:CO/xanthine dehydrogenase Mo-binding subunit